MQTFFRAIGTYLIICIVGLIFGTIFWLFVAVRLIKIKGYKKTWWAIYRGNHIIISNHPSMRDPLLMILMWWPWCLIMPHRFFLWNLPGKNYFEDICSYFPEWIYELIHCIPVDRTGLNWREVIASTKSKLKRKQTVIIFFEEGRTNSTPRKKSKSNKPFLFNADGTRKIRTPESALIKVAAGVEATCNGAWIELKIGPGFGLISWVKHWDCVTISFGDIYTPDRHHKATMLNAEAANKVLDA